MSTGKNIFISHRHEDDAYVADLKDLLKDRGVDVRDSSITSLTPNNAKSPDYIKREILAPRIRWAGTIIVLVSPETRNHEFVDWEIDYANKQPGEKRVVGVWTPNAGECDLPDPLKRHADAVVPWDADKILEALNGLDNWEDPDGKPRPTQEICRIGC